MRGILSVVMLLLVVLGCGGETPTPARPAPSRDCNRSKQTQTVARSPHEYRRQYASFTDVTVVDRAAVRYLGTALFAVDATRQYVVYGQGLKSCYSQTTGPATPADVQELLQWVSGYLSAVNRWHPRIGFDVLGDLSQPQALQWLDTYCRQPSHDEPSRGYRSAH